MPPSLLNVIRTQLFDELGAAIAGDIKRWDAILDGVEIALARKPHMYPAADGTAGLRVAPVPYGGPGRILVFYRLEEQGTHVAVVLEGATLVL